MVVSPVSASEVVVTCLVLITLVVVTGLFAARWVPRHRPPTPESEPPPRASRVAFVLSGGSSSGASQVGMLATLVEHGIVPDAIYGTSVGAINAAAFAAQPSSAGVENLAAIWRQMTRERVFPGHRALTALHAVRQRPALFPNTGLRSIVESGIGTPTFEEMLVPLTVVATHRTSGREVHVRRGSVVDAVLASAAIPGVFPAVEIDGEAYVDGGVTNHVPLAPAIADGATEVYVLLASAPPELVTARTPTRPLEGLVGALLTAVHRRFPLELDYVRRLHPQVSLNVIWPDVTTPVAYNDFSATDVLIAAGRRAAQVLLAGSLTDTTVTLRD